MPEQSLRDMFIEQFLAVWEEQRARMTAECWKDRKAWTRRMVSEDGSVLKATLERLANLLPAAEVREGERVRCEDNRYDLSLVGRRSLLKRDGWGYPSRFHVQLEHESGEHVEEELWKLLFWKADLKVIVMYDWTDNAQLAERNRGHQLWLDPKLVYLQSMLKNYANDHSDRNEDDSEYLIVVGNRRDETTGITKWRFFLLTPEHLQELACTWQASDGEISSSDDTPAYDALI